MRLMFKQPKPTLPLTAAALTPPELLPQLTQVKGEDGQGTAGAAFLKDHFWLDKAHRFLCCRCGHTHTKASARKEVLLDMF